MRWLLALVLVCGCGRWGFEALDGDSAELQGGDASPTGVDAAGTDAVADGGTAEVGLPTDVAYSLLPATSAPEARRSSGAAVATTDDRIWTFGGFTSTGTLSDIAGYNPMSTDWSAPNPSATPPERERHVMGWDANSEVFVVFGGLSGNIISFTHHDELYLYSPANNTWTQVPKLGDWPAPRKDAAMVWMPDSSQFLLYGGSDGSGSADRFSDLWLLSVDAATPSATWTKLTPGGDAAPAQSATCAGYDPGGRRLILHGGESQDGDSTGGTYQYLIGDNVWQRDEPSGTSPGVRSFAGCAWDPSVARLVLYGGQGASTSPTNGIFVYDPEAKVWDVPTLADGSSTPGNRSDMGAAYSPSLGGVYFFGGRTATTTYTNQSWLIELGSL